MAFSFSHSATNSQCPENGFRQHTFGYDFNHSLERLRLSSGLQQLTLGKDFDQSLENSRLPSGLRQLTFGYEFNRVWGTRGSPVAFRSSCSAANQQSLENSSLRHWPSAAHVRLRIQPGSGALEAAQWPSAVHRFLVVFNRCLTVSHLCFGPPVPRHGRVRRGVIQQLAFGYEVGQFLENVSLCNGLQ